MQRRFKTPAPELPSARIRAVWYTLPMPERSRKKKPRDLNKLAAAIVSQSTGGEPPLTEETKNPAAVELGRAGGLKGGPARAAKLSAEQRREIAKKAAKARWKS